MFSIKKNPRIVSIISAVAFMAGGFDALENMSVAAGIAHFAVAAVNLLSARFILRHPRWTNLSIFMVNALFAAYLSYAFNAAGRHRIQYAWMLVCLINVVAGVIRFVRAGRAAADA